MSSKLALGGLACWMLQIWRQSNLSFDNQSLPIRARPSPLMTAYCTLRNETIAKRNHCKTTAKRNHCETIAKRNHCETISKRDFKRSSTLMISRGLSFRAVSFRGLSFRCQSFRELETWDPLKNDWDFQRSFTWMIIIVSCLLIHEPLSFFLSQLMWYCSFYKGSESVRVLKFRGLIMSFPELLFVRSSNPNDGNLNAMLPWLGGACKYPAKSETYDWNFKTSRMLPRQDRITAICDV